MYFVFFDTTQVLCENISKTSLLKQTARWREEVFTSHGFRWKCFLETIEGILDFFHIANSALRMWHGKSKSQDRYKTCFKNNYLHITLSHESPNYFYVFQFAQFKESLNMFIYNMIFFHQPVPTICEGHYKTSPFYNFPEFYAMIKMIMS